MSNRATSQEQAPSGSKKASVEKVQGILNFPSSQSGSKSCKVCGMTFFPYSPTDKILHTKHHNAFVNGPPWPPTPSEVPVHEFRVSADKKTASKKTFKVYCADKSLPRQVARVEKLLAMVNQELNAPEASTAWKDATDLGKAFVIIVLDKAVGLCVTEAIGDVEKQARWMVHKTQEIVPNQVNRRLRVGVSRIWIAPKWRRHGLGLLLLEAVLKNLVYGIHLARNQVAFSQPSHAGGLLAKKFNGVQHKSGEMLVPVYLEN